MSGRTPPPDQADRDVILSGLELNLLVEAGAGSGKTTSLVGRILSLIRSGTARIDEIAAVTFTRKAAGELRQRLQEELERQIGEGASALSDDPTEGEAQLNRLDLALDGIDRAFMGTIHAFCARLLRERPVEARLDPGFGELTASEENTLARRFWETHVEELISSDAPEIRDLNEVGLKVSEVWLVFRRLCESLELDLPLSDAPAPDPDAVARLRVRLEAILDDALPLMTVVPEKGRKSLEQKLLYGDYLRRVSDFDRPEVFFRFVSRLCRSKDASTTLKGWISESGTTPPGEVKAIMARVNELIERTDNETDPPARRLLQQWRTYRYGPAIRMARGAAEAFAEHRRRSGQLTFHDLLALTVRLLKDSPAARQALGERYRRLLVDEFQDTDPLQTELVFMLASDPATDAAGGGWTGMTPRDGALFVVGDPKQSIYRFRRADISLYEQVKNRFKEFGSVVRLTANFRSGPQIEGIVEGVFSPDAGGCFPAEATEFQAAYAPLLVQPRKALGPEGVYGYEIPADKCSNWLSLARWDSEALASWIADRIASGERSAGDFLILTRKKKGIDLYARALEARNLPVLVSGAGLGVEDELRELVTVLEALGDPGDPVRTVAVMEGIFFGVDPQQLLDHHLQGLGFDFRVAANRSDSPAGRALSTLHDWWALAQDRPADEVVVGIVEHAGLLPWAASGELGTIRAGSLAFTMDLVRSATVSEDASLEGALEAIRLVLDDADAEIEAPLEPGRAGAIRIMNLHKAKGLEAQVVVLANPSGKQTFGRDFVVTRNPDGTSEGWSAVQRGEGFKREVVAAPPNWEELVRHEAGFEAAEEDRLLYVAVTRAREELVISLNGKKPGDGPWGSLDAWVRQNGELLDVAPVERPARLSMAMTTDDVVAEETQLMADRERASQAGYRFETVTHLVRSDSPEDGEPDPASDRPEAELADSADPATDVPRLAAATWTHDIADSGGIGGAGWGNAVHATLEAAMRGASPEALRLTARTALLENDRPVDAGEPAELDTLLALVENVQASELWARGRAADQRLMEHPFMWRTPEGTLLEGVMDLAFREPAGWVIVDYKTAETARIFERRLPVYQQQIAVYAQAWAAITGEPVVESHIWRVEPPADASH